MSNKTCRECKHFQNGNVRKGYCKRFERIKEYNAEPCDCFKKPTNGDKIRQMDNFELAEHFAINSMCDFCPAVSENCGRGGNMGKCQEAWLAYFNAPADDCVKQNENHDTQPDLSKADNTESEGNNG